jgi:polysaccharide pyruvyl transferase WcaK-like protein
MNPFSRLCPRLIALRGNYHEANFGDDALLVAAHALLKGPGRKIVVDGVVAYRDERLAGLRSRDAECEQADLIVYGGGTQFFAFGYPGEADAARSVPLLRRVLRKLAKPNEFLIGLRSRRRYRRDRQTPTIAIGLGIGPFALGATAAEVAVAELVRRMKMVWVRDAASEAFCHRHGVETSVAGADLCFTEAFSATVRFVQTPPPGVYGAPPRVGIVLRDWPDLAPDFFERLIEVARRLRSRGIEVRFLSFAPSDRAYLNALSAAGEDVLAWHAGYGPIETFWEEIAAHDLLLTSRFHGAIFAVLSGRPFLALNIEPKLASLAAIVPELTDLLLPSDASVDEMVGHILTALFAAADAKPAFIAALARQRALAATGESALKTFLERECAQ